MGRSVGVQKLADTFTFKEGDTPAIGVMIRESSPGLKACERETNISRDITVHSKKLTHAKRITYNLCMDELKVTREVFCQDAISWLNEFKMSDDYSFLGSLPDISEFPSYSLDEWKEWLQATAELILSKTSPDGVSIFFQSDIKHENIWIDKAYLIQKVAE